jgi:hypothetical protein
MAIVRLKGLGQLKNAITSSGTKCAHFRLVSQCLNQLRYRMPLYLYLVLGVKWNEVP